MSKSLAHPASARGLPSRQYPPSGQRLAAHTSSSAYQPVPSPKSPDWAGPYANKGRTLILTAGASNGPTEAINGIIELADVRQRLPQPTNYQLRMPSSQEA